MIERCPVEWNNDDLAAVIIVSPLLIFGHIKNCEGKTSDMAILQKHAGTLDFIPMVHSSIGVANEVSGRIVSQS